MPCRQGSRKGLRGETNGKGIRLKRRCYSREAPPRIIIIIIIIIACVSLALALGLHTTGTLILETLL
jgi:hypothetical protein